MVPLQVIILALLVMLSATPGPAGGVIKPTVTPMFLVLTSLGTYVGLAVLVGIQGKRISSLLHQPTIPAHLLAYRMERFINWARWVTVVTMGVQIWGMGMGTMILSKEWLNLGTCSPAGEILMLLPTLIVWVFFWSANYPVEKAIHDRSLAYRMAMGIPVHEMPGLGQYLSMQIRHNFFILIPLILAMFRQEMFQTGWLSYLDLPIRFLILFMITPWIITKIWRTSPMTGDLRERLIGVARKYHVKFQNVLIWHTHHHVRNAAVVGHFPWARYFIMSDALLETLSDREIEAVFAHEVGHARHKHLWWYSAALVGTLSLAFYIGISATPTIEGWLKLRLGEEHQAILETIVPILITTILMGVLFSRLSKKFEHQADWFATKHMSESLEHEPAVDPYLETIPTLEEYMGGADRPTKGETPPSPAVPTEKTPEQKLLAGAHIFSKSLHTIVEQSARSLDHGGWLHPSVRLRDALLTRLAQDDKARHRFERRMFWARFWIAVVLALAIGAMLVDRRVMQTIQASNTQPATATNTHPATAILETRN